MGKFSTGGADQAPDVVTKDFTAVGDSDVIPMLGLFNFAVWGTFVGTVQLQRSFDGGTTWLEASDVGGTAISLTAAGSKIVNEPEPGVLYRAACTVFTSGTISTRISGGKRLT